jgi:hypothetical protein
MPLPHPRLHILILHIRRLHTNLVERFSHLAQPLAGNIKNGAFKEMLARELILGEHTSE